MAWPAEQLVQAIAWTPPAAMARLAETVWILLAAVSLQSFGLVVVLRWQHLRTLPQARAT